MINDPFWDKLPGSKNLDDKRTGVKPVAQKPKLSTPVKTTFVGVIVGAFFGFFGYHATVQPPAPPDIIVSEDETGTFFDKILGSNEQAWKVILQDKFRPANLVLFSKKIRTKSCGPAETMSGPFYCPDDEKIYLDTVFLTKVITTQDCKTMTQACWFSWASVLSHEYGHHIQKVTGILAAMERLGEKPGEGGPLVKSETQADCYSGIWANKVQAQYGFVRKEYLTAVTRALRLASDDYLQKLETGTVMPDQFTHGTALERQQAFLRGWNTGTVEGCG